MIRKLISLFCLLLIILVPSAIVVHLWLTDRNQFLRTIYPVQAVFSSAGVLCDPLAPSWLMTASRYGIWQLKSLATQVAYVNEAGDLYHCESGRESGFSSQKISVDSKFFYGSLTKPITASALLTLDRNSDFSIDNDVFDYFGLNNSGQAHTMTIESLMKHTSGIQGGMFIPRIKPWCPYFMDEVENYRINISNRGRFHYSNLGYCILGEVIAEELEVDYRQSLEVLFDIDSRGISFTNSEMQKDVVKGDYRYNDFYGDLNLPDFDFYAISSTAGLIGSAKAYALLIREILDEDLEGFLGGHPAGCDTSILRNCYGGVFYIYRTKAGEVFNVKEGYFPGSAGVVVINEKREVFVWLGNSDTPYAANGKAMERFFEELVSVGF